MNNLTEISKKRPVYIIDGNRTPFLKAKGKPGALSAADLGVQSSKALLMRQPFAPTDLDEVVVGSVMPSENECNIARVIALRTGCGDAMPAYTVQRNCGSGMQSIDSALKDIYQERAELVLAGGVEAMSQAPLKLNHAMVNWLADWYMAKNIGAKIKLLTKLRPSHFVPVMTLLKGLSDPVVNLNMGQTAENLAYQFGITREQMDQFALASHQRVVTAQQNNYLDEITPLYTYEGKVYAKDTGVREDSSIEKLAQLTPFFDKKFGQVTAGNSSQVTDGAAWVILASDKAVKKYHLPVLGKIIDVQWAALAPQVMGLGPVYAATQLLQRQKLALNDIDYWEINEAFAAQVLACLSAWQDEVFCKEQLALTDALGAIDRDRLNVDGGAVALGHPVGASGTRIVLHLLKVMQRHHAKRGMAAICIGGGQGGAMLLERAE